MKRNDAFPKKFISKDDVIEPVKAVIASVVQREIGSGEETETKVVVEFHGDVKPMVLNGTNWDILESAFGQDSDMWIGKTITLHNDPMVMYGGKKTGGVRVRIERNLTDAEKWAAFKHETPGVNEATMIAALGTVKPSEWIVGGDGRTVEQAIALVREAIQQAF